MFNGSSLRNWQKTEPWTTQQGSILCPTTKDLSPALVSELKIMRPFDLSVDLQLIGRSEEDARTVWFRNRENMVQVRLDNQPDQFQLRVLPEKHDEEMTCPLKDGEWYTVRCRIDAHGNVTAWLNGHNELRSQWSGRFPIELGLECQRSGARFKNIQLQYL